MNFFRTLFVALLTLFSTLFSEMEAQFVSFAPPRKFIELDLHFQVGGAGIFQNYASKFPQIKELNTTAGTSFGLGAKAVLGVTDFLGFGTEFNLDYGKYKVDLAVTNENVMSVSNIFLRNRFLYANIPVFASFRFNASSSVRLNVDLGLYYQYGITGKQKQSIYNTSLNELGQLVPQIVYVSSPYFSSGDTFINSFWRSDIGLHFSTGLNFSNHLNISAKVGIGFKNISDTQGLVNPNIHNYTLKGCIGYQF